MHSANGCEDKLLKVISTCVSFNILFFIMERVRLEDNGVKIDRYNQLEAIDQQLDEHHD